MANKAKMRLIFVGLALVAALIGFSSFISLAAPSAPAATDSAPFDSTCGTVTGSGLAAVTHSCWIDVSHWMRHWQPGMVGSDPAKPTYQAVFVLPQAASCTWWGVNATLTSASDEVSIPIGLQNVTFTMSARTTVTVTDQIGGESAGFDVWCSGVVGDDVPTPTPTQTPVPTNTPVPTATATATSTATHTPTPEPTRPELVMTEYELHYYYEGTELPPAVRLLVAGTQQWIEFPLTWVNTFCGCKMAHLPEWVVGVEVGGAIPLRLDAEGWYLYDRRFMRGQQVFLSLVQR